jgi:hypothetical protein
MITIEKLKELQACPHGQQTFLKFFPDGKVSNEVFFKTLKETSAQHTDLQKEYLGWLAAKYPNLKFKERLQLIGQSIDLEHWSGASACYADGLTFSDRLQLIERSDDPKYWADETALENAGLTNEEREQLRERYP